LKTIVWEAWADCGRGQVAGVDSLLAIGISIADDLQILLGNSIEAQLWSPGNSPGRAAFNHIHSLT
jgi:hypothetical protein